jgi:phospholipase/lecithinase/hemolysin
MIFRRCTGLLSGLILSMALAGCGGTPPSYNQLVVFGDDLGDAGSYATAGLQGRFGGGGRFTINALTGQTAAALWTDQLATHVGTAAPCAYETGLESIDLGSVTLAALAEARQTHAACTSYAQGGARVSQTLGIANKGWLPASSGALGQLTVPVTTQISRHVAASGKFNGSDLVLVAAGLNDVLTIDDRVTSGAMTAADGAATLVATANELVIQVLAQVIGHGATRVVVLSLPDPSSTPRYRAASTAAQTQVQALTRAFNDTLQAGLLNNTAILWVDVSQLAQSTGVANAVDAACDLSATVNPVGSALACTTATLKVSDATGYLYADDLHFAPLGHRLIADRVWTAMVANHWQ